MMTKVKDGIADDADKTDQAFLSLIEKLLCIERPPSNLVSNLYNF